MIRTILFCFWVCVFVTGGCRSSGEPSPLGTVREIQVGTWRFEVPKGAAYGSGDGHSNDYSVMFFRRRVDFTPGLDQPASERTWSVAVVCKQYPSEEYPNRPDPETAALWEVEHILNVRPEGTWDVYPSADYWVVERQPYLWDTTPRKLLLLVRSRSVLVIYVKYDAEYPTDVVRQILSTAREVGEWQEEGQ